MTNGGSTIQVDRELITKAVNALVKHHKAEPSKDLLGNDVPVQVLFGLEVAPQQKTIKPVRLTIPHSVHNYNEDAEVCLIVKDDAKPVIQQMVRDQNITEIKKVLTLTSLRSKHAEYQQRRDLLHRYSFFLADDRILPNLTKALGRAFFKAKKQPVPVVLSRTQSLASQIQRALSCTYLTIPTGTCLTVQTGSTDMKVSELVDNIVAVVEQAVPKLPRKRANIQSVSVKLPSSMALPFYNRTPEQLEELAKLAGIKPVYREPRVGEQKDTLHKRKTDNLKSPLLKALKKQKKEQDSTTINDSKQKKSSKAAVEKDAAEKPTKKKRKSLSDSDPKPNDGDKPKKTPSSKTDASGDKSRKKRDENPAESPSKSNKKKSEPDKKDANFVSAKAYRGSKIGYVFKMGHQGLGYYVDVQPVVNQQLLQAILRIPKKGAKKGKRRRR